MSKYVKVEAVLPDGTPYRLITTSAPRLSRSIAWLSEQKATSITLKNWRDRIMWQRERLNEKSDV